MSDVPVKVARGGLTAISAGALHTCALGTTGAAFCWGDNNRGQLGDGTTTNSDVPVPVGGGHRFTSISAGAYYTCGMTASRQVWCWGDNTSGQLGDGTTTSSDVPVHLQASGVLAGKTVTQLATAGLTACVLASGLPYCWGDDGTGELGDGSITSSDVPVAVDTSGVLAGKTLTQITGALFAACVRDSAGNVYCWGDDTYGQLGDGNPFTQSDVPVAAVTGSRFGHIQAGGEVVCGLRRGHEWCWGRDDSGQLGDGQTPDYSLTPVQAVSTGVLAGQTLIQVAPADGLTCAITATARVFCWGENFYGQLGNGTTVPSYVAVAVHLA
jgi:alpha-tubulin suppressor-like RCC1 family protein